MSRDAKQKWDRIYSKADASELPTPCNALSEYGYLLPDDGTALDLACGLGSNAVFLAQRGLEVTAIDISSVAIEKLESLKVPKLTTRCESITADTLSSCQYDVIVVANFLDRSICNAIRNSIAPGGLLFYQTFVQDKASQNSGPGNTDYLLACNELLSLFSGIQVLMFSDMGTVGDTDSGLRNQSLLIARQRS